MSASTHALDQARLARIRARLDGGCSEFDAGIDAILREVERLRAVRMAMGYFADRIVRDEARLPSAEAPADA